MARQIRHEPDLHMTVPTIVKWMKLVLGMPKMQRRCILFDKTKIQMHHICIREDDGTFVLARTEWYSLLVDVSSRWI